MVDADTALSSGLCCQFYYARKVVLPEAERRRTAYHEAGHALVGMPQAGADPVRKVSILPRGRALGVALSAQGSDRYGHDVNYLRGRIIGALGGMAAEQEVFGIVTTEAESDLEMVTRIARSVVGRWACRNASVHYQCCPSKGMHGWREFQTGSPMLSTKRFGG